MIYNNERAYCIEAKRTEPAYQTVIEWLNIGNTENRNLVLSGWLELINNKCQTSLELKDVTKFPYQFIHRFASACRIGQNMKAENVHLFYFFFDEENESIEYYKNWLSELSELTNKTIDIKSFSFRIEETENYKILENQWNKRKGKLDLSDDVIQLLMEEKCMSISRDE
ncbi:MAG: DUF6946 family protein [Treponema sp.]